MALSTTPVLIFFLSNGIIDYEVPRRACASKRLVSGRHSKISNFFSHWLNICMISSMGRVCFACSNHISMPYKMRTLYGSSACTVSMLARSRDGPNTCTKRRWKHTFLHMRTYMPIQDWMVTPLIRRSHASWNICAFACNLYGRGDWTNHYILSVCMSLQMLYVCQPWIEMKEHNGEAKWKAEDVRTSFGPWELRHSQIQPYKNFKYGELGCVWMQEF